jgi:hypothetical protein
MSPLRPFSLNAQQRTKMINITKLTGRLGNQMFQFAALYSHARNLDVDFYFQDGWYFREHQEAVRALYSSGIPARINCVAIHVRRGDYVNNPFYVDLTKTDYYERAIAMFPNDKFMVFSDDISWCEDKWGHLPDFDFSYGDEIEDMNTMAACKAHIIANSSFSWWGAWLSPLYPDNKVIAPKEWYADGDNTRTILPEHWTRI